MTEKLHICIIITNENSDIIVSEQNVNKNKLINIDIDESLNISITEKQIIDKNT